MGRKKTDDHNSIKGQLATFEAAKKGTLEPPAHIKLRDRDWPFWNSLMVSRPLDAWDHADMEVAANLARCKADIEREQDILEQEGTVIVNERGTPVENPRNRVIATLSSREVQLSRFLHVHPEAKQGTSRDQGKKVKAQKEAMGKLADMDDDDLLMSGRLN
jgi:hypothetical protein